MNSIIISSKTLAAHLESIDLDLFSVDRVEYSAQEKELKLCGYDESSDNEDRIFMRIPCEGGSRFESPSNANWKRVLQICNSIPEQPIKLSFGKNYLELTLFF